MGNNSLNLLYCVCVKRDFDIRTKLCIVRHCHCPCQTLPTLSELAFSHKLTRKLTSLKVLNWTTGYSLWFFLLLVFCWVAGWQTPVFCASLQSPLVFACDVACRFSHHPAFHYIPQQQIMSQDVSYPWKFLFFYDNN